MAKAVSLLTGTGPGSVCVARSGATLSGADIQIVAAEYSAALSAIRGVRFAVFVEEQAVPARLEMDDRDPQCFHVLALDADGAAVGTGRIDIAEGGRIGRVAVLASHRGRGVGGALIQALHSHAQQCGCDEVWCHAQVSARDFYERAGYVAEGAVFEEAGIDHITMRCRLVR